MKRNRRSAPDVIVPRILKRPKVERTEPSDEFNDWNLLHSFSENANILKSEKVKLEEIKNEHEVDYKNGEAECKDDVESHVMSKEQGSPVEDLCEFECQFGKCNYRTKHFANLLIHNSRRQRGTIHYHKVPYKEDITRLAVKIRYCLCKVCGAPVLHDHTIVQFHIYKMHDGMLLGDYEKMPSIKWLKSTFLYQGIKLARCKVVISEIKGTEDLRIKILKQSTQPFNHAELAKKVFTRSFHLQNVRKTYLPATTGSLNDDNTTREIADICLFTCQYCNLKTNNYGNYRCHSCFAQDGNKMVLHRGCIVRYHVCCICSKKIPCATDAIRSHVAVHEHGKYKDLDKYMTLAMERRIQGATSPEYKTIVPDVSHITKVFKLPFEKSYLVPDSHVCHQIRNLCEYECDQCFFRTFSWVSFSIHHTAEHETGAEFKEKYVAKARYHACNICARRFLCDVRHICQHALLTHCMTKPEYETFSEKVGPVFAQFQEGSKMFVKCKLCSSKILMESKFSTIEHMKHNHDDVLLKYCEKLRTTKLRAVACVPSVLPTTNSLLENRSINYVTLTLNNEMEMKRLEELRSQVPVVFPPLTGFCSIPKHSVPNSKTTDIIDNLCIFGCTKCDFRIDRWARMSPHLKRCVNNVKFKTDYLVEARYHRCSICSKTMLCDKLIIRLHVNRIHSKDEVAGTVYSDIGRFRKSTMLTSSGVSRG